MSVKFRSGISKLNFLGIHIIEDLLFVASSNTIELASPCVDLSVGSRQTERVENKSLESSGKQKLIQIPTNSWRTLDRVFTLSIAFSDAIVPTEAMDLTERICLCKFQERTWKTDQSSNWPNKKPDKEEYCPWSFWLFPSAKTTATDRSYASWEVLNTRYAKMNLVQEGLERVAEAGYNKKLQSNDALVPSHPIEVFAKQKLKALFHSVFLRVACDNVGRLGRCLGIGACYHHEWGLKNHCSWLYLARRTERCYSVNNSS